MNFVLYCIVLYFVKKLMAAIRTFDFNGNLANSALRAAFGALQCTPRISFTNFILRYSNGLAS